ncbi:GspH/FimT family pseudopilin [Trinickia fusca]|uniref:Type II secretion system protein H n=1 Tax=Trinickia fusca TaxID=2419777 RepID=A0A494XKP8_9BURK|nr:GspH/FimT family pseudopilin [Trinickia fusca]RKP51270.1 prepilin-type N-terminal cleavage/methylation domain-containing protein [Trinickia fusca]
MRSKHALSKESYTRRRRCGGFTLAELLVVTTLIALMAVAASPSFLAWQTRDRVDASARALVASLAYAKSEAMRRGTRVVVCRLDAAERCAARAARDRGGVEWTAGWAVVADVGGLATILRRYLPEGPVLVKSSAAEVGFTPPVGQVIGGFRRFEISSRSASMQGRRPDSSRCVYIAAGGRARFVDGSCGSDA